MMALELVLDLLDLIDGQGLQSFPMQKPKETCLCSLPPLRPSFGLCVRCARFPERLDADVQNQRPQCKTQWSVQE
jgi:hypothetical protein